MVNQQNRTRARRKSDTLLVVSVGAIWLALLGPAWNYVPPTSTTPSVTLNFADLVALNANNPSALQAAYYQWIAWAFAAITTVVVLIATRVGSRTGGLLCVVTGVVQLLVTMFVMIAAAPDLSVLMSGLPYARLGTVLFLGSMLTLIYAGLRRLPIPTVQPQSSAASSNLR